MADAAPPMVGGHDDRRPLTQGGGAGNRSQDLIDRGPRPAHGTAVGLAHETLGVAGRVGCCDVQERQCMNGVAGEQIHEAGKQGLS